MSHNKQHIILNKYFENQINFRSSLSFLINDIDQNSEIIFDFNDIEFISRAALHELISYLRKLDANQIEYELIHLNPDVKLMLDKVEQSMDKNTKSNTYVRKLHFNSHEDLNHYLESMEA